jgi:hypothetical protein
MDVCVMRGSRLLRVITTVSMVGAGLAIAVGAGAPAASATPKTTPITPGGSAATAKFPRGNVTRLFDVMGLTTEQLSITTAGGTFAANCDLQLTLDSPDEGQIAGPVCAGQAGTISVTVPEDGLYTATLVSGSAAVGTVKIATTSSGGPLSLTPGVAGPSSAVEGSTQVKLGFAAHAGERYSALIQPDSSSGWAKTRCTLLYEIVDSNNGAVGTGECGFIDATTIPSDGEYFLVIAATDSRHGAYIRPKLFDVVDQTGTIATAGAPVAVNITTPGQRAIFSFHGSVGNRVSIEFSASSIAACTVTLNRPDGSVAETMSGLCRNATVTTWFDPFTLDQAGTWSIRVDPGGSDHGHGTLQRWGVVDQSGPVATDGTATSVNITTPGQAARFTFAGTSGDRVSTSLTASTFAANCGDQLQGFALTVLRPDGTIFETTNRVCNYGPSPTSAYLDVKPLNQTGTWVAVVDPIGPTLGAATIQVYDVVDQTGTVQTDNSPTNIDLTAPGQRAQMSFAGATGQKVAISLGSSTFATGCAFTILRPDATTFESASCAAPGAVLDTATLDQTGTWTAVVDPAGPDTGSAVLRVGTVTDQTGPITPGGPSVNVNLPTPGQNASFTFSGTTGDQRTVMITSSTFPGCSAIYVSLLRPNGTQLVIKGTCGANLKIGPIALDATGTWTIFVDPQGTGTGTATLTLT